MVKPTKTVVKRRWVSTVINDSYERKFVVSLKSFVNMENEY